MSSVAATLVPAGLGLLCYPPLTLVPDLPQRGDQGTNRADRGNPRRKIAQMSVHRIIMTDWHAPREPNGRMPGLAQARCDMFLNADVMMRSGIITAQQGALQGAPSSRGASPGADHAQ